MSVRTEVTCGTCGHVVGTASGSGPTLRLRFSFPLHTHYSTFGLHCPGCGEELLTINDLKLKRVQSDDAR